MKMSIYAAISAIMDEIPAIGKTQKNTQQGFMYRGIDVVMNVLQPLLAKHKVFVVPDVMSQTREERTTQKGANLIYSIVHVKYTFYAEDGSSVTASVIGEGMDSGDKATNKALAIAFKYACFQVFCIPTEEMKDPDADTPPESAPKNASKVIDIPKQNTSDAPKFNIPPAPYICEVCKKPFKAVGKDGKMLYTAQQVYEETIAKHGRAICKDCRHESEPQVSANELLNG